jgi:hypothetical protein
MSDDVKKEPAKAPVDIETATHVALDRAEDAVTRSKRVEERQARLEAKVSAEKPAPDAPPPVLPSAPAAEEPDLLTRFGRWLASDVED